MIDISVCPGTLKEGYSTYSRRTINEVFDGNRISHILPFESPLNDNEQRKKNLENIVQISISGVQEKYSMRLDKEKKVLELCEKGGGYILKPIPVGLTNVFSVPANEHLTMQIAEQVFKMSTAKNALIFFKDGSPAYITKRFDIKPDQSKCLKEDFATLAQQTIQSSGKNFKYNYSYEKMALLIDDYFPAAIANKEHFFKLVVFNYLFHNGDAHLKNFSRLACNNELDAMLAPAYDLLNTHLHIDDGFMALEDGLYEKDYEHPSFSSFGFYAFDDFVTFGKRIGLIEKRAIRFIQQLLEKNELVNSFIQRSFLNDEMKMKYQSLYEERHRMLSKSFSNLI